MITVIANNQIDFQTMKFDGIKVRKAECKQIVSSPSVRTVLPLTFTEDEPLETLNYPRIPIFPKCVCECVS